jgi:hypothetical protein
MLQRLPGLAHHLLSNTYHLQRLAQQQQRQQNHQQQQQQWQKQAMMSANGITNKMLTL